jgi:hypothetical protein
MGIAFPAESPEYRAARAIGCWSRRSRCAGRSRRSPPPGAGSRPVELCPRTTYSRARGPMAPQPT